MKRAALASAALSLALLAACGQAAPAEGAVAAPAATAAAQEGPGLKTAIFAGGCFWGIEAVFSHVRGVTSAVSGYHGGSRASATYDEVSSGRTRHAEVVRVTYDPAVVRYDQLLQVFFAVGTDPTQLNRQGPDVGTQYRNALIPLNREQSRVAEAYLAQLRASRLWRQPIVTAIEPYARFYAAEDYHQDFARKNPNHAYIRAWDRPKVEALQRMFPGLWKASFTAG